MDPVNYMAAFPQYDLSRTVLQGVQAGGLLGEIDQKRQAQLQAQQAQQQYAQDLQTYWSNPSAQGAAQLATKYPAQREAFKQAWDQVDEAKRDSDYKAAVPFYAALENGANDVAANILQQRISGLKNSNLDATTEQGWLTALQSGDPKQVNAVRAGVGLFLSKVDPKFAENFGKLGSEQRAEDLHPDAVKKAKAEADVAAVASDFARDNAVADLQKKGWDIEKIKTDIDVSKQNVRIAALNAQIAREGNQLKREELGLKLQELKDQREEKIRTRAADVESARGSMDNFLNTADRLLGMAVDKDGKPTDTLRAAAGPLDSWMPTAQQDVADLEALAETIGSQAFMSQIPAMKGTGNLSEKEGDKLQSSLQNLNLKQSPEQFIQNIKEAQRLILKARRNVSVRYGVPDSVPDTPAATATPTEVDALIKKYAGGR